MTLTEAVARYTEKHGRIHDAALRKIRSFHILSNGTMACAYCGRTLVGDSDAAFDHSNGNGAQWRAAMETRDELMMINNGTHPEADARNFLCVPCNTAKGKIAHDDWIQTKEYRRRLIEQTILNENEARIAEFVGE